MKGKKLIKGSTVIEWVGEVLDGMLIDEAILWLTSINTELLGKNFTNIKIEERGLYEGSNLSIVADRLETDIEYSQRTAANERRKETIKKKELKELAKLKAKYENTDNNNPH